jgi:hypothetical protein
MSLFIFWLARPIVARSGGVRFSYFSWEGLGTFESVRESAGSGDYPFELRPRRAGISRDLDRVLRRELQPALRQSAATTDPVHRERQ